jgi:hypothetical protein
MYVLCSMPINKQSIAGSLLQTLTRICTAVGYGIATAIFDAVENKPSTSGYYANNAIEPFAAVFWFAAACAFIGTIFVPFLTIGTQGHKGDTGRVKANVEIGFGLDGGHRTAANERGAKTE